MIPDFTRWRRLSGRPSALSGASAARSGGAPRATSRRERRPALGKLGQGEFPTAGRGASPVRPSTGEPSKSRRRGDPLISVSGQLLGVPRVRPPFSSGLPFIVRSLASRTAAVAAYALLRKTTWLPTVSGPEHGRGDQRMSAPGPGGNAARPYFSLNCHPWLTKCVGSAAGLRGGRPRTLPPPNSWGRRNPTPSSRSAHDSKQSGAGRRESDHDGRLVSERRLAVQLAPSTGVGDRH